MGITHMTIGIIMKGTNTLFHRDYPSFIFEVCTGLIMLLGLFGWMDLLIYGKWFFPMNFSSREVVKKIITQEDLSAAPIITYDFKGDMVNRATPSVINIMITTVFSGGKPADNLVQYTFLVPGKRDSYPPDLET